MLYGANSKLVTNLNMPIKKKKIVGQTAFLRWELFLLGEAILSVSDVFDQIFHDDLCFWMA